MPISSGIMFLMYTPRGPLLSVHKKGAAGGGPRGIGGRQCGKAKSRSPVGPWPVDARDGQDRADALGWGEVVHPIRPKTFARNHTIPQKVTDVSIYDKGPKPVG